jgi:hypothetical protein
MVLDTNLIITIKQTFKEQQLDESYEFCGWGFHLSFLHAMYLTMWIEQKNW